MKPKIVAVMPVSGREELFGRTIRRLFEQDDVQMQVICVCDTASEFVLAARHAVPMLAHEGCALGEKWLTGMSLARTINCDAVMIVGSSNWFTKGWAKTMYSYLEEYDFVGSEDMFYLDFRQSGEKRLMYWGGYHGKRTGDSLGAGRMISRRALEAIDWDICYPGLNWGIDRSMSVRLRSVGMKHKAISMMDEKVLKIGRWDWKQINSFMALMNSPNARLIQDVDGWLKENFEEALELWIKQEKA